MKFRAIGVAGLFVGPSGLAVGGRRIAALVRLYRVLFGSLVRPM